MSPQFRRTPVRWGLLPLVIAGGALGSFVRGLITLPIADATANTEAILAIGIVGSGLLGLLVGAAGDRTRLRAFLGTGALGGFTSYSALAPWLGGAALAAVAHPAGGPLAVAVGIIVCAVVFLVLPVGAAAGGFALGARIARRRAS